MENTPLIYNLLPKHQLLVSFYLKHMNKQRAAEEAGFKSQGAFDNPEVKAAIAEEVTKRAKTLLVGSDFVLREAVRVFDRCMELKEVYNPFEPPDQQYRLKFDATNALKALTIIGKHTQVQAFQQPLEATISDNEVMDRLLRGRKRRRAEAELSIDSDDSFLDDDEEASQATPTVSFLQPPSFLEPAPPVEQLSAPDEPLVAPAEHYEPAEYDSESVHEIGPSPEEKLKLLMGRWRTGLPPGE